MTVGNARAGPGFPVLRGPDSTLAFLREGYGFVGRRCDALGTDGFRTRIMLKRVTCLRGAEAVREFYRPGRMTRRGAMPSSVVALLQDKGSVQQLDGDAHRIRKAMFLDLMTPDRLETAREIFAEEWEVARRRWRGRTVALAESLDILLTRVALRWCGIPLDGTDVAARAKELGAIFRRAGSVGPAYLKARWLRARSEHWAQQVISWAAAEEDGGGALGRLVRHRDVDGRVLGDKVAAVELLNLLRPIVAVGVYITFAAHALHVHRERLAGVIGDGEPERLAPVAEEVRRLYPFFPMIGGRVLHPFDWRGTRFQTGDWLLLDLYGTNRHPADWPASDRFDPTRYARESAGALVPQGGGQYLENHRCPGERLTQVLLTEAIAQLVRMDYSVPEQDLEIPLDRFPPKPRDGMRIAVAG